MLQERLTIEERTSLQSEQTGLIISAVHTSSINSEIVVGRPGLHNLEATLALGGVALFETPEGIFEIRVLATSAYRVDLLVTKISPRPGIAAGFVDQDPENIPFLPEERARISASINEIQTAMLGRADIKSEQMDYLSERLEEMSQASERLGRKDWINYAIGTLTSIVITAAFDPPAAKALLHIAGDALTWVFGTGLRLLP